jgi:glycosyltransferase involved in cell wall biosynthesis
LKVLYIVWEYPRLSETFVAAEIGALIDRGVDVRIISARASAAGDMARTHVAVPQQVIGVLPRTRPSGRALRRMSRDDDLRVTLWAPFAMGSASRGLLRAWKPDLVHAAFANHAATTARTFARTLGIPWTMMAHARDWLVDTSPGVLRAKVNDSAATFAISETTRRGIIRKTGLNDDGKISIVRASVNTTTTAHATTASGQYFAFAGRLVPKKGVDVLVRAFAAADLPQVELVIVGDGPEKPLLHRLARDLGVDSRVHFMGAQDNATVRGVIGSAVAIVHPSRELPNGDSDGIPVVLMEAGLLGTPVIATACGGIRELIVDGETGTLIDQDDVVRVASAMGAIVSSPERYREQAAALRLRVESEFSSSVQAGRLLMRWKSLVRSPHGRAL